MQSIHLLIYPLIYQTPPLKWESDQGLNQKMLISLFKSGTAATAATRVAFRRQNQTFQEILTETWWFSFFSLFAELLSKINQEDSPKIETKTHIHTVFLKTGCVVCFSSSSFVMFSREKEKKPESLRMWDARCRRTCHRNADGYF